MFDSETKVGFELEKKSKNGSFVGSIEYEKNHSVVYVGYKCPSFNFIFPIFATDNLLPVFLAGAAFVFSYFSKKT